MGWTLRVHGPFSATSMHTLPRFMVFNLKKASSVKSVGELRRRKLAKYVIQGELGDSEGAKPVGFSHGHHVLSPFVVSGEGQAL